MVFYLVRVGVVASWDFLYLVKGSHLVLLQSQGGSASVCLMAAIWDDFLCYSAQFTFGKKKEDLGGNVLADRQTCNANRRISGMISTTSKLKKKKQTKDGLASRWDGYVRVRELLPIASSHGTLEPAPSMLEACTGCCCLFWIR